MVLCYAIQPAVHPVTELAAKAGAQSKAEEVVQWYHPEKGREYELIPDPLHKLVHRSKNQAGRNIRNVSFRAADFSGYAP